MNTLQLHHGDCLEVMRAMPSNSVDSIVTDPPYGLSFMGKKWDYDVPSVDVWAECLRVLKPGGHLLSFAGSRTYHRMAVRIEDAGFEIRDMIAWVYGSGFNKVGYIKDGGGQHVRKGWGGSLKPALEPITMARKPLATCATNVLDKVESQLRERGVRGEILWKPENASGAARSKKAASSDSTRHLGQSATSAKNADESVTQSVEKQSLKSSGLLGTSGLNQTPDGSASFQGCTTGACANPSSQPTAESAPAAESKSATSSPLTTSTAAELNTGSRSTEKCTPNYGATDSLPDTESFAGIATGLTGSMATVRINRDSQGFFLWPRGLPEFVPGSPLTVAANVLEHGTGALNIDGCRVSGGGPTLHGGARKAPLHGGGQSVGVEDYVENQLGRWPANLILSDDPEVVAGFPQAKGQQGALTGSEPSSKTANTFGEFAGRASSKPRGDNGSAARFFMQCKGDYNDAWQDLNLPQENANTAEQSSSQQRQAAVSALVLAVSSALPEGLLCSGLSMAPFTSATANELRLIAETATQTIQTIGSKFWRESKPARLSLSLNHASDAEIQRLTDTTTITVSRWKSDGSAEPVTFSITPMSLEVGGKDCAPSMDGKRFIYCAKASKRDRDEGLEHMDAVHRPNGNKWTDQDYRVARGERPASAESGPRKNTHPTVKPTDLMAYLCRLVTPPGGAVLDPFMGSGSTGKAAVREGFRFIGIEREADYLRIATARIEAQMCTSRAESEPPPQNDLFSQSLRA